MRMMDSIGTYRSGVMRYAVMAQSRQGSSAFKEGARKRAVEMWKSDVCPSSPTLAHLH